MNDKTPDIVRGHEIWLEHDVHHLIQDETIKCRILYGHNMKRDGVADLEKVRVAVFNAQGKKENQPVEMVDDCLSMSLKPTHDGTHIVTAEYDAGIFTVTEDGWHRGPKKNYQRVKRSGYYYQYGKTIISGHDAARVNLVVGHELEILTNGRDHYHVGDTIELTVLYDGTPLSDGVLVAAASLQDGKGVESPLGAAGTTAIDLDLPGNWMFKVRHTDKAKGVEDQYDEKVVTAVLTVMGVH